MNNEIRLDEYRQRKRKENRNKNKGYKKISGKMIRGIVGILALLALYGIFFYPNAYEIQYKGKVMGVYKKDAQAVSRMFETARGSKRQEMGVMDVKSLDTYQLKAVRVRKSKWINPDIIILNLKTAMEVEVKAAVIMVDGKEKMIVGDTQKATEVLGQFQDKYGKENDKGGKANFLEKVQVVEEFKAPEEIMSDEEIKKALDKGITYEDSYAVQQGDTFTSIEIRFGMNYGALKELNPTIDPMKVKPGDQLNVIVHVPFLSVVPEGKAIIIQ